MNLSLYCKESANLFKNLISFLESNEDNIDDFDSDDEIIQFEVQEKKFIINKRFTLKEVWLSSPVSGPYHFKYVNGRWLDYKNNELFLILKNDLKALA